MDLRYQIYLENVRKINILLLLSSNQNLAKYLEDILKDNGIKKKMIMIGMILYSP
jgi:hypothetical protein